MINRSKSFLVWILGFLFTFIFGASTGRTQRPQMKYGIKPPPDLIKPADDLIAQPMYGIRPRPVDFKPLEQDFIKQQKLVNKRINQQIEVYARQKNSKKFREAAFIKLRKEGKKAIELVDLKIKKLNERNASLSKVIENLEARGLEGHKLTEMKKRLGQRKDKCLLLQELKDRLAK